MQIMRKYPKHKDSGIEWIGEIPEHWDVQKLKYIAFVKNSNVDKKSFEDEQPVKLCNYLDVYNNEFITSAINFMEATATSSEIDSFTLKKDDILITKDSEDWEDIAIPAYVSSDMKGVLCGYHLAQIRPNQAFLRGGYLFRSFCAATLNEQFKVAANGITRFGLGKYYIDNSLFFIPPKEEQQAIADYLDEKTALIDELLGKKRRQIELLKEQRQGVINQAVTKGLDPNVEMKDSGIEWLGKMPKHWEVKKLKWIVSKIGSGVTPRGGAQVYQDEGVPLLRSQNIHFDGLRLDDVAYISDEIHQSMKNSQVNSNDVLLNITGASIGRCSVVPTDIDEANVNQHVCIMRPMGSIMSDYLHLAMSSNIGQLQVFNSQNGTSREGLNFEQLGNFIIPLPNVKEQEQVVCKSTKLVNGIYTSISKAKQQIQLLQEYRTALISEAVTGKIDVRGGAN